MREKEELLEKNEIAEAEAADVAMVENHCDNPDDAPAEAGQSEDCENVEKSEEGASSENDAFKNFAAEPVQPPKKKKYGWLSTVLLLVAIGLGIWAMFGITHEVADAETTPIWTLIGQSNWVYALVCVAVLLAILASDWMKYAVTLKATTGKFSLRTSLKVQMLGKFYDNVTPFAVGGQPMQIYYLHKKGYSGGVSSAVVLIKYFCNMTCMCLLSLLLMACNTHVLGAIETDWLRILIHVAAWFGLAINMFLPVMVLFFVIFPKFARKLASFVIGAGYKLKIVKDKERSLAKALKTVADFRAAFAIMARKPAEFIALILFCLLEEGLRFAFPFFIMKMFNGVGAEAGFSTMITVMALNVFIIQSVCIIPTPGNSGAIESVGTVAFTAVIVNLGVLGWSVLVWRFCVFYIYILIGLGITVFEFIRKMVRRRKEKAVSAGNE